MDATNQDDCSGDVDLYPELHGSIDGVAQLQQNPATCDDNASLSYPEDSCMNLWRWDSLHLTPNVQTHEFGALLFDEDDACGDDDAIWTSWGPVLVETLFWQTDPYATLSRTGWKNQWVGLHGA